MTIENMGWEEALEVLHQRGCVRRLAWGETDKFIDFATPTILVLWTPNKKSGRYTGVEYIPSVTDLAAQDWIKVRTC